MVTTMSTLRRLFLLALLATGAAPAIAQDCASGGGLEFVCGPKNAEDLVHLPATPWIVASGMAAGAGFYLIDSRNGSWSALAPQAKHDAAAFPNCATPPAPAALNTHGLNLRAGAGGRATLYVVGHGEREAIEVFDVDAAAAKPALTWKGCVRMPEGLAANSVASFADGSLVATVLIMPGKSFADSVARRPTGAVFEWSPGQRGFTLVQGTELPGNNGIEVSADGREIYVVSSGLQTVVAFSHSNPARQLRTTRPLPITPDNVHMGPDGRLLTAGMKNDEPACGGAPGPQHTLEKLSTCPRGFIAIAIDPKTMQDTVLAEGPANPSFSNATMVLAVDKQFWIGTFSGDRVGHGVLR
jgi:SMP-30/gluconolaconase/LRE-like protein